MKTSNGIITVEYSVILTREELDSLLGNEGLKEGERSRLEHPTTDGEEFVVLAEWDSVLRFARMLSWNEEAVDQLQKSMITAGLV